MCNVRQNKTKELTSTRMSQGHVHIQPIQRKSELTRNPISLNIISIYKACRKPCLSLHSFALCTDHYGHIYLHYVSCMY